MIFTLRMPRLAADGSLPSWDALYECAGAQAGYFSMEQARAAGYSRQLLQHYLRIGKVERSLRGVFRLVHFPASDREDLVPAWLWSQREGVFGLQTALAIHQLSDALPARHFLLVPTSWQKRRLSVPPILHLTFEDVTPSDRQWFGAVPVTTVKRTLRDCIVHHEPPDLVEQAFAEAIDRRLVSRNEARAIQREAA
jgi:predicted transcriptional regulator of viral defense system